MIFVIVDFRKRPEQCLASTRMPGIVASLNEEKARR